MKHYKEFTISSQPFLPEILQGVLWELNISGIQEEDSFIKVFCDEGSEVAEMKLLRHSKSLKRKKSLSHSLSVRKLWRIKTGTKNGKRAGK